MRKVLLSRLVGVLPFCSLFFGLLVPSGPELHAAPTFTRIVTDTASPAFPWAKQMGDLDGDGFMDLVVGGANGPCVWYQYPTWTKHTIDAGCSTESGSWLTDIVGDGYLDVIVGDSWYENPRRGGGSATGTWVKRASFAGGGTHDIRAGDLDGDGLIDVVMRGENGSPVSIFKQVSKTNWIRKDVDPGVGRNGLALVDIDQDGRLDIVVGGVWLRNPGDVINGTWVAHTFASWNPYAAIDVADMNGDGKPDLILSVSEDVGNLSWFENPGNPGSASSWVEHPIDTGLASSHAVFAVDMDLDGRLDIVASEYRGSGQLLVYYNNGGGTSWTKQVVATPTLHNISVKDYDNDGDLDIFGVNLDSGQAEIWRNNLRTGTPAPTKVLNFYETLDFYHPSIVDANQALLSIGALENFLVTPTIDPTVFNDANLAQYSAVIFNNPSGQEVLNASQQAALKRFIQSGKGFVGIHNAAALIFQFGSPDFSVWYGKLVGALLFSGVEIIEQPMTFQVLNHTHPSTATLPDLWPMSTSDIYNFDNNPKINGVTVLVNLDDRTVQGGTMGSDHPVAWYHDYDGGRSWYTGAGGGSGEFHTRWFKDHLAGGIRYAIGLRGGGAAVPSPGTINLTLSSVGANESSGNVTLTATRTGGSTGAVSVGAVTTDGTALAGSDYVAQTSTLSWADGEITDKTLTVALIDDHVFEPNETFTVTLNNPTGGATLGNPSSATVTIFDSSNTAPTVATAAAANPSPAAGTTASLSVLGADDGGEANLTYTWATTGTPPAAVTFSTNGTNAAKNSLATFTKAGNYTFQVTIKDAANTAVTSSVTLAVTPTLTSVAVTPANTSVVTGGTQQFTAAAQDQFAVAISPQPALTWTVNGGGTISATGLFTATTTGGPFAVTAASGGFLGTASLTVGAPGPVIIGQTNVLAGQGSGDANQLQGIKATLGQSATIQSLSINFKAVAGNSILSIYTDSSNRPGALVAQTAAFTPVVGWNTRNVTSPVLLNPGSYWLIWQTNNASMGIAYGNGGTSIANGYNYGPPPAVFPSGGGSNFDESIYATLSAGPPNPAPTVAMAAAANPSPATGATVNLSALGADDGGEGNLTYTWATVGTPPAAVAFNVNGTNAAKNAIATFSSAGNYSFQVTIRDAANGTVTSNVNVTVTLTLASITVTPSTASVATGGTQQFTATARDQFTVALSPQPTLAWTVSGGGTIGATGLFTATTTGGPFLVTATSAGINGVANVTVTAVNTPPTVVAAAAANPSPAPGATVNLSVLGADNGGEANLTYTWATTGTPPAAVAFSANGTNAAKNTVATFTKAGNYSFQVTIRDTANTTVTSSVALTVTPTFTSVAVTPASASVAIGGTQQFTATARDQFAAALSPQPALAWTVSGGGTISATGLFTAANAAGGPFVVTAVSGAINGTAAVTVTTAAPIALGITTVLSGRTSGDASYLLASRVTLAQAATIQSLSVNTLRAGGTLYLAIYSDNGGYPGALKATTAQFTPTTGWNTKPVVAQALLPAGTYWLVLEPSSNTYGAAYDTAGSANSSINRQMPYGPMPSTFPAGGGPGTYRFSLYATVL